jgi:hypothetical protein
MGYDARPARGMCKTFRHPFGAAHGFLRGVGVTGVTYEGRSVARRTHSLGDIGRGALGER